MEVSKGQCGTLVVRGKNQRKIDSGVVAWTGGVKFTTQKEGEEFTVVACEEHEKRKADDGSETEKPGYHGMFATNFDISEHEVASEVVAWGASRRTDFRGSTVQMAQKRVRLESLFGGPHPLTRLRGWCKMGLIQF